MVNDGKVKIPLQISSHPPSSGFEFSHMPSELMNQWWRTQDYQSLIDNINDASKKCSDLRKRLYKMDAYADKFIKLPSGVWNKIDAQS